MNFKNILIVRTDRIGDVVLTTPAIKALREAFPGARLTILVSPVTKELVGGNELLDEVLIDDRHGVHKGLGGYLKIVSMIKKQKFDLAVNYHTKKRTNLLCFLAGIPLRTGYKNSKFGFLLNRPVTDERHLGKKHEAQYCLDVLREIGVNAEDLTLYLPVRKDALMWVDHLKIKHALTKHDRVIAVHCGASDPAKQWPAKNFAQVIDSVHKRFASKVILIGSFEERRISQEVISLCRGSVIDVTGETTIAQLAALLSQCSLLISNDSGPVHMAAGVGIPVVSIFTRNQPGINPERWRPLGGRSRVVSVEPSQNQNRSFKKAGVQDPLYMGRITPTAVLEAVDSLFKLC
jgi:heptosyltransferase-2